ncbi:MAG: glycosyltransferase [Actinomycetota bacterium]|nr:glycosyltransferase [Actinomycetota bacterium]
MQSARAAPEEARAPVTPITERTAIVHDWFSGLYGSERVVDAMRTGLFARDNRPDIYTFHAARDLLPPDLAAAIVRESRLAALPGIRQRGHDPGRWRYLLPYMPTYFSRLPLEEYDLVISSSHACAANVRPRPDALHVCYSHTPMRYAWMPETDRERVRGTSGLALRAVTRHLRRIDLAASRRPDLYIANSSAVRARIRRFYGRDAVVVHPPVDLHDLDPEQEKDPGLFLWVHRLVPYKNPELVVEAFRALPYRLVMVGIGPLERTLRSLLPANVELRGWVERSELVKLYARASGFIHVAEEDFGMTMVEALGSGTPVIALDRGGARDIVRGDVDGLLLARLDHAAIRSAVRRIAAGEWDREELIARSRSFSRPAFLEAMAGVLDEARAARSR